jgi:FkbM family methyltransferase
MGPALLPWVRRRLKTTLRKNDVKELVRTESNLLIQVGSNEPATRRIQVRGSIDPIMEWTIRRYARTGTVAVDIGANLGLLSLVMADRVGPEGTVYAIEPNTKVYPYAKTLFHLNAIKNVKWLDCACSDKEETVRFHLDDSDHTKSRISAEGEYEIRTLPLDLILAKNDKPLSLIKIDVEGHELKVLGGSIKTLKVEKPALVFEVGLHSQNEIAGINDILKAVGYDVIGVLADWGVEQKPLSDIMTRKTHCNVLALSKKESY